MEGWSPKAPTTFTDEELVVRLAATRDDPSKRGGNWWTFFSNLPLPERERLEREANALPPSG